jgi:hypothetical protein
MRKPKTTEANKKAFIKAYVAHLCMVTKACETIGISRTQYYFWMRDDAEFAKAIEDAEAGQIEFVEDALLKRIKEGSDSSIQFYLKTKGKRAGYAPQIDITSNGETLAIPHIIQLIEVKKDNGDGPSDTTH